MSNELIVCDTKESIEAFRLLAIKGALKLEVIGMRRRGKSVLSIVKQEFGLKGTKEKVYDQYVALLKEKGILVDTKA